MELCPFEMLRLPMAKCLSFVTCLQTTNGSSRILQSLGKFYGYGLAISRFDAGVGYVVELMYRGSPMSR